MSSSPLSLLASAFVASIDSTMYLAQCSALSPTASSTLSRMEPGRTREERRRWSELIEEGSEIGGKVEHFESCKVFQSKLPAPPVGGESTIPSRPSRVTETRRRHLQKKPFSCYLIRAKLCLLTLVCTPAARPSPRRCRQSAGAS